MKIIIYLGKLLVFVTQESGSISTRVLINQSVRVVWFGETSLFLWTFAFWGGRAISLETVKICIIPIVLQNLLKFPQRWLAIAAAVTNALSGDGERRVLMELRNLTLSYKSFRRKFPRSIWRNWLFHLRDNNDIFLIEAAEKFKCWSRICQKYLHWWNVCWLMFGKRWSETRQCTRLCGWP